MSKNAFLSALIGLNQAVVKLLEDDGVYFHSSLYAFLRFAHLSLTDAIEHYQEYNTYIDE